MTDSNNNNKLKLAAAALGGLAIAGVCFSLGKQRGRAEAAAETKQATLQDTKQDEATQPAKQETKPASGGDPSMQFATSQYLYSDEGIQATARLPAYGEGDAYALTKAPDVVDTTHDTMITVDPEDKDNKISCYKLLISTVTPRPIAFITSFDEKGQLNGAPFSYFSACNGNPPVVTIGFTHSASGRLKHTLDNIKKTREFVVNTVTEENVQRVNHTCGNFDAGVDELKQSGLTTVPSTKVKVPRCAETPLAMECKVLQITQIHADCTVSAPGEELPGAPRVTGSLVVAQVVMFHISESVWNPEEKVVDMAKLRPIGRMGGVVYSAPSSLFPLPRPQGNGVADGENIFVAQADTFKPSNN